MQASSSFYTFVDDDCVIDLGLTVDFLVKEIQHADESVIYCGFQYESGSLPIRGFSKISVTWQQYPAKVYPAFCRGVMVILSYPMIVNLYEISRVTRSNIFPLEDVMIYGILRFKLELQNHHIFPVLNGGKPLVFYPWDDSSSVTLTMKRKWNRMQTAELSSTVYSKRAFALGKCAKYNSYVETFRAKFTSNY